MNQSLFVWLIVCLIWGSTWFFIKLGLRDLPPFTFAGLRFLIAAAVLWLIVAVRRRPLPRAGRDWWLLAWVGALNFAVNYALIFWGEQYIASGLAAVLQATIPAFGLVFAHHYLPNEQLTARKMGGVLLGIAGVGLIFLDQLRIEGTLALWGSAAVATSAVVVSFSNVMVKARVAHVDSTVLAAAQMSFGLVPLLVFGVAWEGNPLRFHWTARAAGALFYLALVGSAAAFMLYYWLLQRVDVTKTMLVSLITPVIALLIGWLGLSERLTWRVAAGTVAILAGISLIVVNRTKPRLDQAKTAVDEHGRG